MELPTDFLSLGKESVKHNVNVQEILIVMIYYDSSKAITIYSLDVIAPTVNLTLVATN